ncbi:MAG: hypothetical protein Q4A24_03175 [Akkermansia sp.]|nr:hypothetical protein [Akkermansia sp.]
MSIRTTLMLMAATVALPVSAQQPAEVYTALSAPVSTTATAEQRAAAMPALALMPADADVCFTVTNLPTLIDNLHSSGILSDREYRNTPKEMKAIHSFALAGGKDSAQSLIALSKIYNIAMSGILSEDMLDGWEMSAAKNLRPLINQTKKDTRAAMVESFKAAISEVKVGPAYGVLVATPGNEDMLAEWYAEAVEELQEVAQYEEGIEAVTVNGFVGTKIQIPKEEPSEWDSEYEIAVNEEVSKRTIYVLLKHEGDKIIGAVCENPDQINTAATPAESILGTDKLAGADDKLNKGLLFATYASPQAVDAYKGMGMGTLTMLANNVVKTFKALESAGGENATRFAAAAKSGEQIISALTKFLMPATKQPVAAYANWSDSSIDFSLDYDCAGCSYKPGKLSLLKQAADPNTIVYMESTYWNNPNTPDLNALIDNSLTVADGFIATLPTAHQDYASAELQQFVAFLPELKEGIGAFKTATEGMDNTMAVIVDKGATMPAVFGGQPGNTTSFPRLAIYSGVSNRAKLSEGWDKLLAVGGKIATKVGSDPAVLNMLPIIPKTIGKSTSYSVALPWFTENLIPNLTISDASFVVGSSSALNAEIAETATGSMDFAGCVCTVKFTPFAQMMRDIANDLQARADAEAKVEEDAKPAPVTPPVVVAIDDEEETEGEEEEYVEEDDFDEEEVYSYHYHVPSPAEQRASNAKNAAEALEAFSKFVDCANMTGTVKDGQFNIRLQLKLNK